MKMILLALIALPAYAANLCVGTADPSITCGTTYAQTAANVQTALDAAACGDTVYIQPGRYSKSFVFRKGCSALSPITVTTGKAPWLPCANCRLTPSHRQNLPILASPDVNTITLVGQRAGDGSYGNAPPAGWNFVGIAFELDVTGVQDNAIVSTGGLGQGPGAYYIQNASDAPDSITFDRVFIAARFTDTNYATSSLVANGSNITLKNSFFWPLYGPGKEVHGVLATTGPGPTTLTNNFISAQTIPYLTGGTTSDYFGGQMGNWTAKYNYFMKPYKWWPNAFDSNTGQPCTKPGVGTCYQTANPYPNDFLNNGSKTGCVKNLGEWKLIDGALNEFNVHQTNWIDGFCQGQWYGHALTVRASVWPNPAFLAGGAYGSSLWLDQTYPGPGVGSLTTSGTNFSWQSTCCTGSPTNMSISPGTAVCQIVSAQIIDPTYDPSVWEHDCHKVATITHFDPTGATPSTGTLTTAFSTDINHPVTTLTGAIDAATLTIPVASVAGWAAYSWIVIDSEWMQIASVGASSLTVTSRGGYYTTAASHSNGATVARVVFWEWNTDYDATYRNITIRNSIWRDVAGGFNVLAKDRSGWGTDSVTNASRLANVAVTNNLIEDTFPNQLHNKAIAVYPQEQATAYQNTVSGNNISFEHNTFNWKTKPSSVMYWVADGFPLSLYSKINNFTMRSNLMPDVDPMNPYALGLSGGFYNTYTLLDHVTSGNQFFGYNQFNLVSTTCSTVDCTGALSGTTATDVIYTPGSYYVMDPSAPAYHAGYLGTNMGVDPTLLPAITSLTVTPLANTAMLQFTLNGPINAAGSTQPCMLEVSPQQNLRSYIGSSATVLPYTTTNDLNPAYFKQPDQSNRTNPLLPAVSVVGSTVTWQIGLAATVTGDDGNPHDLRLTPLTPYWGRLMCYGDTQNFSFVTTSLTAQTSVMFVGASKIVGRANVTSPGSPLSLSLLTDGALATLTNGPLATMVN